MLGKIKNSLLITLIVLLILCALPIYFVVNYQKQFNIQATVPALSTSTAAEITDYNDSDYFEYQKTTDDPFYSNTIPSGTAISQNFFLRKGQSLLFYKHAITSSGNDCGDLTQLTVTTTPQPAVLCKGTYPATMPNRQCIDFVEICEFKYSDNSLRYRIKQQGSNQDCISITKICLPSVSEICPAGSQYSDAYKCIDATTGATCLSSLSTTCSVTFSTAPASPGSPAIKFPVCSGGATPQTKTAQEILFSNYDCSSDLTLCPTATDITHLVINFSSLKKNPTQAPQFAPVTPPASTCENALKSAIQQSDLIQITGQNNDACYDLTNYTGQVANIPPAENYAEYLGFLNNGKNAKPIAPISSLSADKYFGNLDYSVSKTIFINEKGELSNLPEFQVSSDGLQMKMLFVNNADLSSTPTAKTLPAAGLQTNISFHQNQTYKNGQMLKVVLCKEDDAAYLDYNQKYKFNENYETKCENYFLPPANIEENLIKTYNSLSSRVMKSMPNSLSDADYFTQNTTERFTYFTDFIHKTDSIKVVNQSVADRPVSSGVYNNDNQTLRSPYMFDKNGWLKLMVANEPRLLKESTLRSTSININKPICHNYDNNFYCHNSYATLFPPEETPKLDDIKNWEYKQLKHDLRLRLAFQIDDPDINKKAITTYYPNAVLDSTSPSIAAGNEAYNNNTGKYEVTVKVTNPARKAQLEVMTRLNNIVNALSLTTLFKFDEPIGGEKDQSNAETKSMFSYLITNSKLKSVVKLSAVLMLMIFALMYLMGLSKLDHQTLVSIILKLSFVLGLLNPEAWELYQNIFAIPIMQGFNEIAYQTLTILSPQDIIDSQTIPTFDKANIATYFYQSIDVITMIFNQKNHFKIMAIFFSYSYGFVYVFIIYYGFYIYLFASANAILMFILAKIIMILLINLLPLFLLCLFFKTTQKMLDNWFSLILGYGFQQIFIIIAVAFFNIMIVYILKMILGYKICWDSVLKINSGSLGYGLPFNDIILFKFWQVEDSENGNYIPSLFHILYFLILVYAMQHFINFAAGLGSRIAGGVSVEGIANAIKGDLTGNIASKIALKAVNKLTKDMKNRLIDKISFGYSGELADKRIQQANERINDHREAFQDVQKELNTYQSSSEFLALSDEEKDIVLKSKANQLAEESGYGNYANLIKSANQSKQSSSTTLPGMLFDVTGSQGQKYIGKATNAITGRNLVTGLANDTGDFNEANLLGINRRINSKDVVEAQKVIDRKIGELENIVLTQPNLTPDQQTAIRNRIENLKIQKESIKLKQTTWSSMEKLRSFTNKHSIEATIGVATIGAVGGVLGGAKGALAGAVGGFTGGAAVGVGIVSGAYNIVSRNVGHRSGAPAGVVAGVAAGAAASLVAIPVGVVGVGIGSVVGITRGTTRGAISGTYAGVTTGIRFSNANIRNINPAYLRAKIRNINPAYLRAKIRNINLAYLRTGFVANAKNLKTGFVANAKKLAQFTENEFITSKTLIENTSSNIARATGSAARATGSAARATGSAIIINIVRAASNPTSNIARAVSSASSNIKRFGHSAISRGAFAYNVSRNFVASAFVKIAQNDTSAFVKIAQNDAKYNLQQKLKDNPQNISADKQEEIIDNFIEQIKPYLSGSNLNKLNSLLQVTDYQDRNLGKIHSIIENNLAKLNQDKTLFNSFAQIAQQEKKKRYESNYIGNLTSSTVGAALVGVGYATGYTMQSIQNYREKSALQHKQHKVLQTIDTLMSTLTESSREKIKTLTKEIEKPHSQNINGLIKDVVREVTTNDITTQYTDKAKLLLALQEYAKTIN